MSSGNLLAPYFVRLESSSALRWQGRVTQVIGQLVSSQGPFSSVGESCEVVSSTGRIFSGEIVGFRGTTVLAMPLEQPAGIRYGDRVVTWGAKPRLRVGTGMIGRVIDGRGEPLDSRGPYAGHDFQLLDAAAPLPMAREAIREAIGTGIRAVDGFLTCGRGQRLGIFGGSGVGKSTLLGMMARNTGADLTVLALVGERGREVRHFLEDVLEEEGRKRSVVVVSTSDQSPLLRIRAALAATAVAEYFCAEGKNVLLVVDSITRLAMAQREISLAAGEPPTAKGYTPSVFALLARLIERAGKFGQGSITAFYTVLMEGDDQQDPLVDGVRALLDGHIMLDRKLASQGHYSTSQVDKKKIGHLALAIQVAFQELGAFPTSSTQVPIDVKNPLPFSTVQAIENAERFAALGKIVNPPVSSLSSADEDGDLSSLQRELQQALALEITRKEVALRVVPDGLVISLREIGFFESGSADIKSSSQPAFERITSLLEHHNYRIRIEGHTDNIPIHNSRFDSNWELSTARATQLVRLLMTTYHFAPERLAAAGYAAYHPVSSNQTAEGRAQNRRVDLVILGKFTPLT